MVSPWKGALVACGATVLTTFPNPFTLPASLGWLPGAEGLVPSSAVPSSPDVFVSLDAASPARLGELARLLDGARTSVVIDDDRRPGVLAQARQLTEPPGRGGVQADEDVRGGRHRGRRHLGRR